MSVCAEREDLTGLARSVAEGGALVAAESFCK
jgi:hypothetical protein